MSPIELVVDNDATAAVTEQALTWPEKARALQIVDAAAYERASGTLLDIKALRREVDAAFDPIIADANRVHKTACEKKRQAEAPLVEAERIIKGALSVWATEQDRIRREEERRLQEEARRHEEVRRLEEAAALEREAAATGDATLQAEAEAIIAAPVYAPPVTVAPTTPKVAGIVHRETWSARVVNIAALIKFVAAHPEHQNLLTPNTTALNQLARSMKSNLKIDGVQACCEKTVAAGGR
jgi:hypothetical protein